MFPVCSLEGGRLLDYLASHDALLEEKVAFFIKETLEALQHLHTCRVAHLDLKVRSPPPTCLHTIDPSMMFCRVCWEESHHERLLPPDC